MNRKKRAVVAAVMPQRCSKKRQKNLKKKDVQKENSSPANVNSRAADRREMRVRRRSQIAKEIQGGEEAVSSSPLSDEDVQTDRLYSPSNFPRKALTKKLRRTREKHNDNEGSDGRVNCGSDVEKAKKPEPGAKKVKTKAKTKAKAQTKVKNKTQTNVKTKAEAKVKANIKPKAKRNTKIKAKTMAKTKTTDPCAIPESELSTLHYIGGRTSIIDYEKVEIREGRLHELFRCFYTFPPPPQAKSRQSRSPERIDVPKAVTPTLDFAHNFSAENLMETEA